MAFPANFKKAKPFGGKETKGEEKAEGNPFAKGKGKGNPFAKKMAKGGMVMRGTGAATRGKSTKGVI
jgi:hypothetical protein